MKKIVCTTFVMVLVLSLTACGKGDNLESSKVESQSEKNKGGTYTAQMNDFYKGYKGFMTVNIIDGVVDIEQFDEKNAFNVMFSQNVDLEGYIKSELISKGIKYHRTSDMINFVLNEYDRVGSAQEMELVAGATVSSVQFIKLLDAIMEQNEIGESEGLIEVPMYVDGVYIVEEGAFNSGWKDFVEVTVENGVAKITRYDSYNIKGEFKSADEATKIKMAAFNKGKGKGEIYPKLYQDMLTQSFANSDNRPDAVEMVAGATESSTLFKRLIEKALDNAFNGRNNNDTIAIYKNGIYKAEMAEYSEDGFKDFVELSILEDYVVVSAIGSKNEEEKLKSDIVDQNEKMKAANKANNLPELSLADAYGKIINNFNHSGYMVTDMENVSGATKSSNNFKLMVGEILRTSARSGDTKTLTVQPIK